MVRRGKSVNSHLVGMQQREKTVDTETAAFFVHVTCAPVAQLAEQLTLNQRV